MSGFLHLIVPASRFRLLSGPEHLVEYTFNTGVAKHRFCVLLRISSSVSRARFLAIDVDAALLDDGTVFAAVEPFDGRNSEPRTREGCAPQSIVMPRVLR